MTELRLRELETRARLCQSFLAIGPLALLAVEEIRRLRMALQEVRELCAGYSKDECSAYGAYITAAVALEYVGGVDDPPSDAR